MRWNRILIKNPYASLLIWGLVVVLIALQVSGLTQSASSFNGFDLTDSLVPAARIQRGGPPRDGIPSIDTPRFLTTAAVDFLHDYDRVLGLNVGGVQRAYPVRILDYHEIVNDRIGGRAVTITWCPLCGSGMAFSAELEGRQLRFGVSGLLYNSDLVLYDRETESLWSQLMRQAISGPLKGTRLRMMPLAHTSWADWRRRHPDGQVLSLDTGHDRDYTRPAYPGYAQDHQLYFPVDPVSRRYHPKELVIGLEIDGRFKAYPFTELSRHQGELWDRVAGRKVQVVFDPVHRSARVLAADGLEIPTVISFWFAWYAFHPDTAVFQAEEGDRRTDLPVPDG